VDLLSGGGGADVFVYSDAADALASDTVVPGKIDEITDFRHGAGDRIDLSAVFGDGTGTFIGASAFGHSAGEVRFESAAGGGLLVSVDVDGDAAADMMILLDGVASLGGSDFIL
jgi:Ca2+-binding RTX toxin-like protein